MKIRTALLPVGIALALTTGSITGTALAAVPNVTVAAATGAQTTPASREAVAVAPAAQQNCFNGGPTTATWRYVSPISYAPGTFCLWDSTGPLRLVFQTDGNLVLYQNNTPVWSTGTYNEGVTKLLLRADGNIVIYSGSTLRWASNHYLTNQTSSTYYDWQLEWFQPSNRPGFTEVQYNPFASIWTLVAGECSSC